MNEKDIKFVQTSINLRSDQSNWLKREDVHLNLSSFVRNELDKIMKEKEGGSYEEE